MAFLGFGPSKFARYEPGPGGGGHGAWSRDVEAKSRELLYRQYLREYSDESTAREAADSEFALRQRQDRASYNKEEERVR
jgi:hypothetical protein